MRAHEFINEASGREPLRKGLSQASNMTSYDSLDNNNKPYLAYRFGVALAISPRGDMHQYGPIGSNFNMVDYSDADTKIRQAAEKMMGIKSSRNTGKGSEELPNVNTTSPVAPKKKNKYGV